MLVFDRDRVVRNARLHALSSALSTLYWGQPPGRFVGDGGNGRYDYDNGQGDRFAIAWSPKAAVLLTFGHESSRSQYRAGPWAEPELLAALDSLLDLPGPLRDLSKTALGTLALPPTAALVLDEGGVLQTDALSASTRFAEGLEQVVRFGLPPADALTGDEGLQSWAEVLSLPADVCGLCLRWLAELDAGPVRVTEDDAAVLLAAGAVDPEAVEPTRAALAPLDLALALDAAALQGARDAEREERVRGAMNGPDLRLLEAARAGDRPAVEAAMAEGASLDARTIEGQWEEWTPAGNTALILAILGRSSELALWLIDRGAPLDATNRFGQSALHWAAERGELEVLDRLYRAGAALPAESARERAIYTEEARRRLTRWGTVAILRQWVDRGRLQLAEGVNVAETLLGHDAVDDLFLDDDAIAASELCDS